MCFCLTALSVTFHQKKDRDYNDSCTAPQPRPMSACFNIYWNAHAARICSLTLKWIHVYIVHAAKVPIWKILHATVW